MLKSFCGNNDKQRKTKDKTEREINTANKLSKLGRSKNTQGYKYKYKHMRTPISKYQEK